jgi:4-alpha-glucanotransferase
MRDGELLESDYAIEDERFHLYAQWVADEQIASIADASERDAAALYLDLPLGVHADGYDAWRERHLFTPGVSAGAPPDALFTGGQDWGFHPLNPVAQRASGHQYFIECIRHHLRHARMLRLDHVMSLYRLYWIPRGLDAKSGAYVRYPDEELFAVIALESARHDAAIVGEDLGTVPAEVRKQMEKRHIMRMYVVQYELSPDNDETITPVPRDVIASINTHDMPTLRGYVLGTELKDQLDLGLVDQAAFDESLKARSALVQRVAHRFGDTTNTRELLTRILAYLAESPARGVLVNLEDLWLEDRPQNVPGTSTERQNWRRRARLSLDEITRNDDVREMLELVERARSEPAGSRVTEGQPS